MGRKKHRPLKYTTAEVEAIARKRGGVLLSEEIEAVPAKQRWRCAAGHVWKSNFHNILRGHWCPYCAGRPIHTIKDMRKIAKKRGGVCLSEKYVNNHTKLKWACAEGHQWETTYGAIRIGAWCPYCAGLKRLTIGQMRAIARRRGGKCLSDEYAHTKALLRWQCKKGHEWEAQPTHIIRGHWCHECNENKPLTIEEMQKIARERGGECLSGAYKNVRTKLKWQCAKGHIWETTPHVVKKQGSWCPVCAGRAKLTLEDMKQMAAEKGGKCLSRKYTNLKTPLKWKCAEGHRWVTIPDTIRRGCWCPVCARKLMGRRLHLAIF